MAHPFDFAQAQHAHPSRDWSGYCLVFVRSAFEVASRYPSAAEAWRYADHKHPTTDASAIPRGVPVFWTGGSHGYGHIALSRGDGTCWTTDFVRGGKVDVANVDDITRGWGLRLVGWTEDLNGVRVYTPPAPAPKPPPAPAKETDQGDDDMPTPKEVWHELIGEKVVGKKGVHADAAIATTYVKVQELEQKVDRLTDLVKTLIAKKG